jgi:hypothetical protein
VTLAGNTGADTLTGGSAADTITGGTGADAITAGAGVDNVDAGAGNDTVNVTGANDAGAETLAGGADSDTLSVSGGGLSLDAGVALSGFETIALAEGINLTLAVAELGDNAFTAVNGTAGGAVELATFNGTAGADSADLSAVTASNARIVVNGDAGNDTITGSASADSLNGGLGDDTFNFATRALLLADTVDGGAGTVDTITFTAAVGAISDADFSNVTVASVEKVVFTSGTNSIAIDAVARAAGVATVVGGTGNDTFATPTGADSQRSGLTIDLSSGGVDTLQLLNTDIGNNGLNFTGPAGAAIVSGSGVKPAGQKGFGGAIVDRGGSTAGDSNANTLNATATHWDGTSGTSYVVINGFQAGVGGDRIDYALGADATVAVGGFANNVSLVSNDLSPLSPNSVIEINANEFQISDPTNLLAVATMLDSMNNVQDGTYYIVIYDGSGTGAFVYVATATEGDGFDFAETAGGTLDTDTLELIAEITGVTSNSIDASNFGGG